jgi:16S rRNA G527 N7-methylase RsmG
LVEILEKAFKELKLPYNKETEEKFILYKDLLKEWNKKINII